ncbi:MAG: DNA repair protein RecO [Fimbriimonadaceae bacterium]
MEAETVHALVLRRRDSGENDRQLTILTAERGVVDVVAKGARKGGSRLAGSSEPFAVCTMSLAPGRRRRYVTQTQPITSFPGLRTDYDRMAIGIGLLEIAAAVLPHEDPAPRAFKFLVEALRYLEVHPKPIVAAVWAEVGLMQIAGFQPRFDACAVTGQGLREAEVWVSPMAGGYVVAEEAIEFPDRFRARFEILVGLARIGELDAPPKNLKFAVDCLRTLVPFWAEIVGRPLPAHDAAVRELCEAGRR